MKNITVINNSVDCVLIHLMGLYRIIDILPADFHPNNSRKNVDIYLKRENSANLIVS